MDLPVCVCDFFSFIMRTRISPQPLSAAAAARKSVGRLRVRMTYATNLLPHDLRFCASRAGGAAKNWVAF